MNAWNEYKSTMTLERPVYDYAREGKLARVVESLDYLEDINEKNFKGHSVLMLSAYGGHQDLTHFLISRGADVNSRDLAGSTILMGVAFKGYIDIFKMLVEAGADVDALNEAGQNALDYALMFNRQDVASYISSLKNEKHKPIKGFFKSWYGFVVQKQGEQN